MGYTIYSEYYCKWYSFIVLAIYFKDSSSYGRSLVLSLGKREVSLTLFNPSIIAVNLSSPMARPPWGGTPYLKVLR